ncbi:uncharacterized protein N7482_003379 [Penicillium canariense]|uniref:Transcription factor domain-containing protein n=1 Tax=Penicillium canariense TaxID=189055 RepID=A0A9W9LP92_9EURO|nr:uncharacterized protein N7482_003379 [Penicillium canariense]KAJ5167785.1 hypothetical protein N7482_003379 [Penicillium canariense]
MAYLQSEDYNTRAKYPQVPSSSHSHTAAVSNDHAPSAQVAVAIKNKPLLAGYFGPTSFVSPLTDDVDLASGGQGLEVEGAQRVLPPYWVQKISEILLTLEDFSVIECLIWEYYNLSQSAAIHAPFVLSSLGPFKAMCAKCVSMGKYRGRDFGAHAETFDVPPTTAGKDFHTLFTGAATRLEMIGVICSLAGRARYPGLARDKFSDPASGVHFARTMLAAIWLVHENLLLSHLINGDSSPHCWNRLPELSTDIFALGLHRDSKSSDDLPEFLLESRPRQFAAAHQLDKSIATFLSRPPRIPLRCADCRIPLDISDDALASVDKNIQYSATELDANNWNVHSVFQRSSWMRVRFIVSMFRDEILEVSLQKVTPATANLLNDICHRCHLAWESLPPHLRYTPQCWESNYPVAVCLFLIVSYLAYLCNDFLIQGNPALLSVSADILSAVLTIGTRREQMVDLPPDFIWTRFNNQRRTGEPFLYEGSRSVLLRNLSVFISHLETIVRPDNPNYALFQRASEVFSKIIDEILEPQDTITALEISDASLFDFDQMIAVDGLDLFNTMDFGVAFNQWLF